MLLLNTLFEYNLEDCFFFLYVCFKIEARKSVVSTINWNIEKNTNAKGLKGGTKRIDMKMT